MSKVNKVLIIEDDVTFAESMEAVIKRAGCKTKVIHKGDEGLSCAEAERYDLIFIDCLLPKMSGVEVSKELRKKYPADEVKIVLMSGIYTDRTTVKDALYESQASEFLKKPFETADLLNFLKDSSDDSYEGGIYKSLYSLFGRTKSSVREKRRIIESIDQIHCFDLPFILSLLVEIKATGHLNIVGEKNELSGITLSNGQITQVDIADAGSYIGRLLVNNGYLVASDLEWALSSSSNRKIGTRLIDNNMLSPHAFDEALKEQMNIRLSKMIHEGFVKINFVNSEPTQELLTISAEDFAIYLHDWILSKVTAEWLRSHYMKWGDSTLRLGPHFGEDKNSMQMTLIKNIPNLFENIQNKMTLSDILSKNEGNEDLVYKAIHFLVCKGLVLFDEKVINENDAERLPRLKKILLQMNGKNSLVIFDMMGGRRDAKESDVHMIFADFKKTLGPEPLAGAQPELIKVFNDIKKMSEEAYHLFLNKEELAAYEKQWNAQVATMRIRAQTDLEEVKKLLGQRQHIKAQEYLDRIIQSGQKPDFFTLYLAWNKIGLIDSTKDKSKAFKSIGVLLTQIPAEEKYSSLANLVNGLFLKAKGETLEARKFFEKALSIDSGMIEAKRELNLIKVTTEAAKPPDLLSGDLKDVVSYFFKRK
jgi:CheY-like chemotaxis protein